MTDRDEKETGQNAGESLINMTGWLVLHMYEPHEAREDTVLFPAFRKIVSPNEYDALDEDFKKKEYELFGDEGFEKNVEEVSKLEKALGIHDLAQFTPSE